MTNLDFLQNCADAIQAQGRSIPTIRIMSRISNGPRRVTSVARELGVKPHSIRVTCYNHLDKPYYLIKGKTKEEDKIKLTVKGAWEIFHILGAIKAKK